MFQQNIRLRQPRTQAQKLKIGTLQCFYIDQWLIWASAQGCLGRTRRRKRLADYA